MKFKYLSKEVDYTTDNLESGINYLIEIDSEFKDTFLDKNGKLKWNCIIAKNGSILDFKRDNLAVVDIQPTDELFLMLQLCGG